VARGGEGGTRTLAGALDPDFGVGVNGKESMREGVIIIQMLCGGGRVSI
jgi:hypothetical protein